MEITARSKKADLFKAYTALLKKNKDLEKKLESLPDKQLELTSAPERKKTTRHEILGSSPMSVDQITFPSGLNFVTPISGHFPGLLCVVSNAPRVVGQFFELAAPQT